MIFLVGARRSGTNWLERILTAHPEIVVVPTETYLFSHGIRPLADCFQHANPAAPSMGRTFIDRDTFLDSVRDLVDRVFLEPVERGDGARYVVERTPWHASHLRLIGDVYPDARVINIVRDGRSVARSLLSMPWGPSDMAEAAAEWAAAVRDAREGAEVFGDHFRDINYEQLLQDPRSQTGALFDWLGLELGDAVWERILVEAGSQFNVDPGSPGIRADKWRDELSPKELGTFERIAGNELQALGYPLAGPGSGPKELLTRGRRLLGKGRLEVARLRHPRQAVDASRRRWFAQRLHADQIEHNNVVSRFERHVAAGEEAEARALLAPKARVSIETGPSPRELRGLEAHDALIAALAEYRDGERAVSGRVHVTPYGITSVKGYESADGRRGTQVLVYEVTGRKLRDVALYRFAS